MFTYRRLTWVILMAICGLAHAGAAESPAVTHFQEHIRPVLSQYCFDDIADVLTISPILLEKYVDAAKTIVANAVPTTSAVIPEKIISGRSFNGSSGTNSSNPKAPKGSLTLSFYEKAAISNIFQVE